MKRKVKLILTLVAFFSIFFSINVDASENTSYSYNEKKISDVYQEAVDNGQITANKYSFDQWSSDEKEKFRSIFEIALTIDEFKNLSYEDWIRENNYGVIGGGSSEPIMLEKNPLMQRSVADNKRKFMAAAKAGDILIVNDSQDTGMLGHAAIMTTDNWVLEMPGGKYTGTKLKNNNRQIQKGSFFDKHSSKWTKIYRVPDSKLVKNIATYADHTFYNPSGGTNKTINIDYQITSDIRGKNPSYCSKLVYQAFYYGSGNLPVMFPRTNSSIISPGGLVDAFQKNYTPKLIGNY